jgi:peptide/nickel transport system substrate-binding protein
LAVENYGYIAGIQVLNSTSIEVYSHYSNLDPNFAAITTMTDLLPFRDGDTPWALYQAMSDLVANHLDAWSAEVAATTHLPQLTLIGEGANGNPADITNLEHYLSTRASESFIPPGLTQLQTITGVPIMNSTYAAASYRDADNFLTAYGNGLIGWGPFYISNFQAATTPNYADLVANPNFHLTPALLGADLFSAAARISVSATIPSTVSAGSSISFATLQTPVGQKVATPLSGVNMTIQLINSNGVVVNQAKLLSGSGGSASYTVPSVPLGAYTIIVYASTATQSITVPTTFSTTILAPTTGSSTTSTSGTGTQTTATSTTTSSAAPVTSSAELEIIAGIVVVIIIIAAVVLFVRRRPSAPATSSTTTTTTTSTNP